MSAGLVASPVLTSKPDSEENKIAREATRLMSQSAADTKYDPIPEKRVEEPFAHYSVRPLVALATVIGVSLIALGVFHRK